MNKWCVQYESSIFVLILVTLYPFIAEMLIEVQIWILVQIRLSDLPVICLSPIYLHIYVIRT